MSVWTYAMCVWVPSKAWRGPGSPGTGVIYDSQLPDRCARNWILASSKSSKHICQPLVFLHLISILLEMYLFLFFLRTVFLFRLIFLFSILCSVLLFYFPSFGCDFAHCFFGFLWWEALITGLKCSSFLISVSCAVSTPFALLPLCPEFCAIFVSFEILFFFFWPHEWAVVFGSFPVISACRVLTTILGITWPWEQQTARGPCILLWRHKAELKTYVLNK